MREHCIQRYWGFIPPRANPTNFCFEVIPTFWPQLLQYRSSPPQLAHRRASRCICNTQYGHVRVSDGEMIDAGGGGALEGEV